MLHPSRPYTMLKFSLQLYRCNPGELTPEEYATVQQHTDAECSLQAKILASAEREGVTVPEQAIRNAADRLAANYPSQELFEQDLRENDMDRTILAAALATELTVESIMGLVAGRAKPASAARVAELVGQAQQEEPEQRRVRHILITINEDFPENCRPAAQGRISTVRDKAMVEGAEFSILAQRFSECPSALQGGSIGLVTRDRIHPTLGETLFALQTGEISEIVESNMGFHILLCEEVIAGKTIPVEEIRSGIRARLLERERKKMVRTWLAAL
jgi:peptidyl-prolyl cis-trans isomerase C